MSGMLAELLDSLRLDYIREMDSHGHQQPYLTAHRVANSRLALKPAALAKLIAADPKLLASRASNLVEDPREIANPSVGAIITANLVAAGIEGLMLVAQNRNWVEVEADGELRLDAAELDRIEPFPTVDYSATDGEYQPPPGRSLLSILFNSAEEQYQSQLESGAHDAYQLAIGVASEFAIFAPEDLAPLIMDNPLLLGLRNDGLVDPSLFKGDPPAGMIISAHLTEMLVQQLVERALALGYIGHDAEGVAILDEADEDEPTVH